MEVALKTVSSDKVGIAHGTPGSSSADTPAPQCTGGGGEETEKKPNGWGAQDLLPFGALLAGMGAITYATMPSSLTVRDPTVGHVWFYGWLAALTTGLGALPLLFLAKPSESLLGASNAVAAGMMLSASYSLVTEGVALDHDGERAS